MRSVYRDKRDQLLQLQLLRERKLPATVHTRPHGMHVTLLLDNQKSDLEIARQMAERGFEVLALSKHYLGEKQTAQGLVVGFTNAREGDFEDFSESLVEVLASAAG